MECLLMRAACMSLADLVSSLSGVPIQFDIMLLSLSKFAQNLAFCSVQVALSCAMR